VAATKVESSIGEAALTTKIKAKMALDDTVKARSIDVTTRGTTVTLSGIVQSKEEHDRAMALARETEGVTDVIDDLKMLQRVG
jgi:hyperosmotically inducible protein